MRRNGSKSLSSRPRSSKKKLHGPVIEEEDNKESPCSHRKPLQARISNYHNEQVSFRHGRHNGMEGRISNNQDRLSRVESQLAELKSAQMEMDKKFGAMVEKERRERIDGFKLSDLKIIGLQYKLEDCQRKMKESVKNLYYGQKYLLQAIDDLASLRAQPLSLMEPMERNVSGGNDSTVALALEMPRLKCKSCRQTFGNQTRHCRHETICNRNRKRRAEIS